MTLIGIQQRWREAGRIRLGDRGGKNNAPRRLDNFRLTSTDMNLITQVARTYGGKVSQWDMGYQVTISADKLDIMIPPSSVAKYSQYWEMWTAGECLRRCNGETDQISGGTCPCYMEAQQDAMQDAYDETPSYTPDDFDRKCKPTTRVGFILQKLGTLGIWRMDTGSFYAASELPQTIELLTKAADSFGRPVPAILRIDPRTSKSRVNGKVQTRRFAIPVIDLPDGIDMETILSQPSALAGPQVSHEQIAEQPEAPALEAPPPASKSLPEPTPIIDTSPASDGEQTHALIAMRELGIGDDERHQIVDLATAGRTNSSKELTKADLVQLWDLLTTKMRDKALDELRMRFTTPDEGYAYLRERGLEGKVKTWRYTTWQQAYELVNEINKDMETNDDSEDSDDVPE